MRKIVYYENVLEYLNNTQTKLQISEVKNWQLCRTCLSDADSDCADLLKLCIMGTDGNLLNVKDMLTVTTGIKIPDEDKLPVKICKECLNKLSTFYYFKLQTARAENVLKRLLQKLAETVDEKVADNTAIRNLKQETSSNEVHTTTSHTTPILLTKKRIKEVEEVVESSSNSMHWVDKEDNETTTSLMIVEEKSTLSDEGHIELKSKKKSVSKKVPEQNVEQETVVEEFIGNENQEYLEDEHMSFIVTKLEDDEEVEIEYDEEQSSNKEHSEVVLKSENVNESMGEEYYLENEDETSNNTEEEGEVIVINLAESMQLLDDNASEVDEERKRIQLQTEGDSADSADLLVPVEKKRKKTQEVMPLLENLNCNLCGVIFRKQCLLVQHVQENHPNTKAFKCRECDSMFTHLQSLSRHMTTHKSIQYKNICNLCGKAFLRSDDWKRHIRVHTGERPYICGSCGKAFKQTNELKEHQLTHSSVKLFECNICGHRLSSRNGLYIHRKAHTGIKNFVCDHCGKRFLTNGERKSHMNVHLKKACLED